MVLFGGGAASKLWKQIIADVFDTKIVTLNVEEGPSYGGALLAGVGSGIYKSVQDAADRVIRQKEEVLPVAGNAGIYKKIYDIYQSLYKDLKDDFAKLAEI